MHASSFFLWRLLLTAIALKVGVRLYCVHSSLPAVTILLPIAIFCRYPQIKTANAVMENSRYSQLQGKVAAESIGYSNCPLFEYISSLWF